MIELVDINKLDELNEFLISNNLDKLYLSDFSTNPFMKAFVYREVNKIIGYINYSIIYDKAELNQIIVAEDYRKSGLGSKLLRYFLNDCKSCKDITLEVRKDNLPALKLYEKLGFKSVAVRKNYYGNTDGLLMIYKRGE